MDIGLLSMAVSQGQVGQQVSLSVIKKAMDQAQVSTDELTKMLDSVDTRAIQHAAEPHLGVNIDLKL